MLDLPAFSLTQFQAQSSSEMFCSVSPFPLRSKIDLSAENTYCISDCLGASMVNMFDMRLE